MNNTTQDNEIDEIKTGDEQVTEETGAQPKAPALTELEQARQQADEYLGAWKRAQSDFINYKKDEMKRTEEFAKFANERLLRDVIESMDTLTMAMQYTPAEVLQTHKNWFAGLSHAIKQFDDVLKRYGVEKIQVDGQAFNPELHEAVETTERSPEATGEAKAENATKSQLREIRSGYTIHGKVLRPARVSIG